MRNDTDTDTVAIILTEMARLNVAGEVMSHALERLADAYSNSAKHWQTLVDAQSMQIRHLVLEIEQLADKQREHEHRLTEHIHVLELTILKLTGTNPPQDDPSTGQ